MYACAREQMTKKDVLFFARPLKLHELLMAYCLNILSNTSLYFVYASFG